MHHIADSHINAFVRMKLILTEDNPKLKTYDQDLWAKMDDYTLDIAPSIAIVAGVQERMANLLEHANEEDLAKTADHPDNGRMSPPAFTRSLCRAWQKSHQSNNFAPKKNGVVKPTPASFGTGAH